MVFCISPAASDLQETVNTLQFADQAKRMKVAPVSARLLAARATPSMSFRTPRPSASQPSNQTIHTGTPSKAKTLSRVPQAKLNRTIGTPGKRAREELPYVTPQVGGKRPRHHLTSTAFHTSTSARTGHERVLDVSQLGISVIEPPQEETVSRGLSEADLTTMMEPMMMKMTETMGTMMTEQLGSVMAATMERQMEKMAAMMAAKVAGGEGAGGGAAGGASGRGGAGKGAADGEDGCHDGGQSCWRRRSRRRSSRRSKWRRRSRPPWSGRWRRWLP